jgi:hypothetical protein
MRGAYRAKPHAAPAPLSPFRECPFEGRRSWMWFPHAQATQAQRHARQEAARAVGQGPTEAEAATAKSSRAAATKQHRTATA